MYLSHELCQQLTKGPDIVSHRDSASFCVLGIRTVSVAGDVWEGAWSTWQTDESAKQNGVFDGTVICCNTIFCTVPENGHPVAWLGNGTIGVGTIS